MAKKAQFYIFVAVLLCISAYSLLSFGIVAKEKSTGFGMLYENYIHESENVINNALYTGTDVFSQFDSYTNSFITYAKTRNTDFGVLYMIKKDDELRVVNYLSSPANITSQNITIMPHQSMTLKPTSVLSLRYKGNDYNYTFTNESVQFKALAYKS